MNASERLATYCKRASAEYSGDHHAFSRPMTFSSEDVETKSVIDVRFAAEAKPCLENSNDRYDSALEN